MHEPIPSPLVEPMRLELAPALLHHVPHFAG